MNLSVYGAGYVGLVSAACLASLGHNVLCADINPERVLQLNDGICPIYEEDLPELLQAQLASGRLSFTSDVSRVIAYSNMHLIATGTPSLPDGSADLSQVFEVANRIAEETVTDAIIVTKSTVPVGTGQQIEEQVRTVQNRRNVGFNIYVASNPEFLREGSAVYDFLHADRIIIGGEAYAQDALKALYKPLTDKGIPLLSMSRQSAELAKYSANAMLACRISFMNQVSAIAEQVGADIEEIQQGLSLDHRIGPHFLQAGIGYGGSCFPKDIRALIHTAKEQGVDESLLKSIDEVNQIQKNWVFNQLKTHFNGALEGKKIAIWGLSFKPNTDDMREASSLVIIQSLLKAGASVNLYDPIAIKNTKQILQDAEVINWFTSAKAAIENQVDALVIATEWDEFKNYSLGDLSTTLREAPVIDGRNCFQLSDIRSSQIKYYYSVGRPIVRGGVQKKVN